MTYRRHKIVTCVILFLVTTVLIYLAGAFVAMSWIPGYETRLAMIISEALVTAALALNATM